MKRLLLTVGVAVGLSSLLHASPAVVFDLQAPNSLGWMITNGPSWRFDFHPSTIRVVSTSPQDSALIGDSVSLPIMYVEDVVDHPAADPQFSFATAVLHPVAPDDPGPFRELQIVPDTGVPVSPVFRARVKTGGFFVAGTNWFGFQLPADDIDVIDYVPGYAPVLDEIAALDAAGYPVDLAISGVASESDDLYNLILHGTGLTWSGPGPHPGLISIGGLYGAISVLPDRIPAPGALLLAGLGVVTIGWLRTRRSL